MAKRLMIDQLHVSFLTPDDLSAAEAAAVRRTLRSQPFHAALSRANAVVLKRYRTLRQVRVKLER